MDTEEIIRSRGAMSFYHDEMDKQRSCENAAALVFAVHPRHDTSLQDRRVSGSIRPLLTPRQDVVKELYWGAAIGVRHKIQPNNAADLNASRLIVATPKVFFS